MSVVRTNRSLACVLVLCALMLAVSVRPAQAVDSASISGSVMDRDGEPALGVVVQVIGPDGDQTLLSTDEDGRFVASGLPAGRYTVCFLPPGEELADQCWEDIEYTAPYATPIDVVEGQQVSGIDAVLVPASFLRGVVTDTRGRPAAGVLVSEVWFVPGPDGGMHCCTSTRTAGDGSFELGPLYSGEHAIRFSDTERGRYASEWWDDAATATAYNAPRVRVDRGESVDHVDAELADLAHITGQVRGAGGSPARDAVVRVFEVAGSGAFTEVGRSPLAADGSYDVGGLQPGTYRLGFDAAPGKFRTEYWNDVRRIGVADDLIISGTTSVTGIKAVLSVAPPVRATRSPSVIGHARVGEQLRVTAGTWDVPQLRFTYQWRADGVVIPRATERRLRLTPQLRGKRISVRVKATATAHERSPGVAFTRRTEPVAPSAG